MKNFLKKIKKGLNRVIKAITRHKGISLGICCGILVVSIAIGVGISFSNKKEETEEQKMAKLLENLGRDWYDNYFYNAITQDKTDFLSKFTESGLKIDLNNLSLRAVDGIEENLQKFEDKKCDKIETKVIIYPQEPYGPNDYKIETVMQCTDLDSENKK